MASRHRLPNKRDFQNRCKEIEVVLNRRARSEGAGQNCSLLPKVCKAETLKKVVSADGRLSWPTLGSEVERDWLVFDHQKFRGCRLE